MSATDSKREPAEEGKKRFPRAQRCTASLHLKAISLCKNCYQNLTWYMAYLGTIFRLRRRLLVFMKTMATGHREVMVRTPTKGLIQMAVPVISSCKRTGFHSPLLPSGVVKAALPGLTSERSKLPLVHSTTLRTERAVLRIAYCNAPTLSQNSSRLVRVSSGLVLQR